MRSHFASLLGTARLWDRWPAALVEPCILASTDEDDFVLDPFFGCGTVGLVARKQQRRYLGIELNPEYVSTSLALLDPISFGSAKPRKILTPTDYENGFTLHDAPDLSGQGLGTGPQPSSPQAESWQIRRCSK